jgi:nucleoid DNA-binding protein
MKEVGQSTRLRRADTEKPKWGAALTKKEIAKQISAHHGIDQIVAKRAVQEVLDLIVEALLKNGRMELRNFGVFELKRRAPRVARNPRTNEQVSVPAKTVVAFQPGKKLAEMVSQMEKPPGVRPQQTEAPGEVAHSAEPTS